MDRMTEFLDNFKKILLAVKVDHTHADPTTCTCGHKVPSGLDWEEHIIDTQARKLIEYLWDK